MPARSDRPTPGRPLPAAAALGGDARRSTGRHQADQGGAARPDRRLGPYRRGGLRRRRAADQGRGRRDRRRPGPRRDDLAGHRLRRHRGRHRLRRGAGPAAPAWLPGRARALRPRTGPGLGSQHRPLRDSNEFFEHYRGPADDFFGSVGSKPEIYPIYWSPAQMQARQNDRMARVQAFLNGQWKHESERRAVVRPGPGLAVPGPHPPPAAGRRLRRPGHPPGPGQPRPVDDRGLPEGLPPPVRRHRRAVRPLGRGLPYGRAAVPRHDHVLGLPDLPGLDRPVRHGPRPGRAAHRPDPRRHGLPDAAPAAGRRARRRHVRRHHQPDLPGQRQVAPAADAGAQRHPRRPGR